MELLDALNWRYATKKMNGEGVDQEKIDKILEAVYLAPSSSGLQPYKVFVIEDKALREKILPIASGQSQITDASHLLVFAAWDNYTKERIDEVFRRTERERGLPEGAMADYNNYLVNTLIPRPAAQNFEHAARQAYIGLGFAVTAAAQLQVDTTPMEGFDNASLDQLLHLEQYGVKSVALLTVGYRDTVNDWLVNLKKVRTPKEEFFVHL